MEQVKQPYGLDPAFERVVLWYCASSAQFWSQVGYVLDSDSTEVDNAKLVLETCKQISKEMGRGPDSCLIVLQRLQRRVLEGKVTRAQIEAVSDMFNDAEDNDPPELDLVVNELVPILQHRMRSHAIMQSHEEYAKHGDFEVVLHTLESAAALGHREEAQSTTLGASALDTIAQSQNIDRFPTGVMDLDLKLKGGVKRGSLNMWLADSGGGKSMSLIEMACSSMRQQQLCGFISVELPKDIQLARLYANLTGLDIDDILEVPLIRKEAGRRHEMIKHVLGACEVGVFPAFTTTVRDLEQWVETQEQKYGAKMDTLVVDYADRLHFPVKDSNQYEMMKRVYEGLRVDIAVDRKMWVWTASQATRPDKKRRTILGQGDVADSMHKIRATDGCWTLNPMEDDETQTEIFCAKNRLGTSGYLVGPIHTEFERARLVAVSKELGPW